MEHTMEYFNARTLVISWIVGFVGAGLALSVSQKRTADQSCWGASPWQNEIAIWNLGAIVMLLGVLWSKKDVEPALLPGLFVLSLAFSIESHRCASSPQGPSLSDERSGRGGQWNRGGGHSGPLCSHSMRSGASCLGQRQLCMSPSDFAGRAGTQFTMMTVTLGTYGGLTGLLGGASSSRKGSGSGQGGSSDGGVAGGEAGDGSSGSVAGAPAG